MKTFWALVVCALAGIGSTLAEEKTRFEVSGEASHPSFLSGPLAKGLSGQSFRVGFAPTKEFQLTLTGAKWDGILSRTDTFGTDFALDINRTRPANSQINFRNAELDKRDLKFTQLRLGFLRTIQIAPKRWDGFVGLEVGVQTTKGDFTWRGFIPPVNDPTVKPAFKIEKKNEFLTAVRGGLRYSFINWCGVQINFEWIPIGKMFGRDYNGLELGAGLAFRFGKM